MKQEYKNKLIYEIQYAKNLYDIDFDGLFKSGIEYKVIFALEESRKLNFPVYDLIDEDGTSPLLEYFSGKGLYYLDNYNLGLMKKERISQKFDYTISLDSNFCNYIHKFIEKENFNKLSNIPFILSQILNYDLNFDCWMYYLECSKLFIKNGVLEWNDKDKDFVQFKKNLISLELFKDSTGFIPNITKIQAEVRAKDFYQSFYDFKKLEEFYELNLLLKVFIIKLILIKRDNKQKKVERFLNFLCQDLHMYFDREFVFAISYLTSNDCDSDKKHILRKLKPRKNLIKEDFIQNIDNVAWDFTLPRLYEKIILDFHERVPLIPFFLTNDEGLKQVLRLYKTKAILRFEKKSRVLSIPTDDVTDLKNKYLKPLWGKYFSPSVTVERSKKFNELIVSNELSVMYKQLLDECFYILSK